MRQNGRGNRRHRMKRAPKWHVCFGDPSNLLNRVQHGLAGLFFEHRAQAVEFGWSDRPVEFHRGVAFTRANDASEKLDTGDPEEDILPHRREIFPLDPSSGLRHVDHGHHSGLGGGVKRNRNTELVALRPAPFDRFLPSRAKGPLRVQVSLRE
jgi:hypothetical protein